MQAPALTDDRVLPYSILVVEDDAMLAGLLQTTLRVDGFATAIASSGEAAVEHALREVPHLVLLDLMLPGIDGFEVVRRLRSNVKTTTWKIRCGPSIRAWMTTSRNPSTWTS